MISDDVLANYQATGTKLEPPKESMKYRSRTKTSAEGVSGAKYTARSKVPKGSAEFEHIRAPIKPPKDPRKTRVFILLKSPDDTEVLNGIKQVCDRNLGMNDVVLVLEEASGKRAIKMPFHVEPTETFVNDIKKIVGDEAIKVQ